MSDVVPDTSSSARLRRVAVGVFLTAALLGWFLWVDPRLVYFRPRPFFPSFLTTRSFLADLAGRPGGLTACAAAFLSQLFHDRLTGALVLTAIGVLLGLGFRLAITGFGLPRPRVIHLAPAYVLALAYARYGHALETALLVCLAALAAGLLSRVGPSRSYVHLAAVLVVAAPAGFALGGGYALLGVTMALGEAFGRRRWVPAAAWLLLGIGLPFLMGRALWSMPLRQAFYPLPFRPWSDHVGALAGWLLVFVLPGAVLLSAATRALLGSQREAEVPAAEPSAVWVRTALICVLAAVFLVAVTDRLQRKRLRIEMFSRQARWEDVLRESKGLSVRQSNLLVSLSVNRALYHAGRLREDMLAYPQFMYGLMRCPEEFFFPPEPRPPRCTPAEYMRMSDIFFELGRVNEAEHMATEALEDEGYRPWILERIGLARVAKGEWESGRSFLVALSHDLVCGARGRRYLRMMESDPELSAVPEVERVRSSMSLEDTAGPVSIERHLLLLLDRNPANRMAMDYLMAHYLLTGDLEGFVARLGPAVALAGGRIPDLYQEALLVYAMNSREDAQAVERFVGPDVRGRFEEFRRIVERHAGDRQAAMRALATDFRRSYLPYYTFFVMKEGQP